MRVIVSPHLDDAVFSCWVALQASIPTIVVTCFAGDPDNGRAGDWDHQVRPGLSSPEVMALRRAEDIAALSHLSAIPVHLPVAEAQYRPHHSPAASTVLESLLRPLLADTADVWIPAGFGGHPDHLLARETALAALSAGTTVTLYADLPYAAWYGWPFWVTGRPRTLVRELLPTRLGGRRSGRRWRGDDAMRLIAARHGVPRVHRLSDDEKSRKAVAVQYYVTQAPALGYGDDAARPAQHMLGYEVWWPLAPPTAEAPPDPAPVVHRLAQA